MMRSFRWLSLASLLMVFCFLIDCSPGTQQEPTEEQTTEQVGEQVADTPTGEVATDQPAERPADMVTDAGQEAPPDQTVTEQPTDQTVTEQPTDQTVTEQPTDQTVTEQPTDQPPQDIVMQAILSGHQEVPPVETQGVGKATVTINAARDSIAVTLEVTGVTDITAAHIHLNRPGMNGPVIFNLATQSFTSPLTVTLQASDLQSQGNVTNFAEAIQAIRDGRTYINVHTQANPAGEVRGHIGGAALKVVLSGQQEVPAVDTQGQGTATVTINNAQTEVRVELTFSNVQNAQSAHIHVGMAGGNGPVIFPLSAQAFNSPLSVTLQASDLQVQASLGVNTMADAVDAMLSGRAYINVHTTTNAAGEIRGQVGPVLMRFELSGMQEVPALDVPAGGAGWVMLNGDHSAIGVQFTHSGLQNITSAHIHVGMAGTNGPVIFPLANATFGSPFDKTLTSADLQAQANQGVSNMNDAINALISGLTYVNVHTQANAGGEIRGQVGRVSMRSVLSGSQEVPSVTTNGSGNAMVTINSTHTTVSVHLEYSNVSNITAAHIHIADVGDNGGVILPLSTTTFTSPLDVALTATDLQTIPANGINTFSDAVGVLIGGRTYINIHTTANTGGEIRGQVGAGRLTAALDGQQEVPAVTTTATGSGWVVLNAMQTALTANVSYTNLTGITSAHIHVGARGSNGPVIFPLSTATFTSPLNVVRTATDLQVQASDGVSNFTDAVNALFSGRTYINIHTTANASGEIRGQLQ